jgi:hypothetical protein
MEGGRKPALALAIGAAQCLLSTSISLNGNGMSSG